MCKKIADLISVCPKVLRWIQHEQLRKYLKDARKWKKLDKG
jgi:hypothetical protein